MAISFHPDKVAAMGEEYQKGAKEKFQQIQDAYETIKKRRGFK
jgi:DnaJ like chaperone protein